MKRILILPLLLSILFGCTDYHTDRLPLGWPASGVAEADSVMERLERLRISSADTRAEGVKLTQQLCSIATMHPENEIIKMRRIYATACTLLRHDEKEAVRTIELGMLAADSSASPFDWNVLRGLKAAYGKSLFERYRVANDNIEYFRRHPADLQLARSYEMLGNVLHQMDDDARAIPYYDLAGEHYEKCGATFNRYTVEINRAIAAGPDTAATVLLRLLDDPVVVSDPNLYAAVLQNAYIFTDSTTLAADAISLIDSTGIDRSNLPGLRAMSLLDMIEEGDMPGAMTQTDSIRRELTTIRPALIQMPFIYNALANVYYEADMKDSCITALSAALEWTDKAQEESNLMAVYAAETARMIAMAERNSALSHQRMMLIWSLTSAGLLIVVVWMYFLARRRRARRLYERQLLDDKIDSSRQVQLAQATVVEESEKMIDEINNLIANADRGASAPGSLGDAIRRVISNYRSAEDLRKGYLKVNASLDPNFTMQLKKDYPGLSESMLRIAGLIAAGVDNTRLASILSISTKSLYTTRYRLRTRLGLTKEESLEDFLRRYASSTKSRPH